MLASAKSSFDDLVCPQQHRLRNLQAQSLRGFQIDHQFELRRLLDGQVGGLGTLENLGHVDRDLSVQLHTARTISYQASGFRMRPPPVYGRQAALNREVCDPFSLADEGRVRQDDEPIRTPSRHHRKSRLDLTGITRPDGLKRQPPGCCFGRSQLLCVSWIGRIGFQRMPTRDNFGTTSLRSSSCFPTSSSEMMVGPVMFPPGRAKLAMSPTATGSTVPDATIGITLVARWAA